MNLSVIIPLYNGAATLPRCLLSLGGLAPGDDVVIVDNGSTDRGADIARELCPSARLIRNEKNLGAARARNQAIEASAGAWVVTLDCDVVLGDDFFERVREALARVPQRVGALQPKVLSADGRTLFTTGIGMNFLRRFQDRGRGSEDLGRFDRAKPPFGACSAAAVYRRAMLDDVRDAHGYFDERFFFLVEDVDLAWRARKNGWHTHYCPKAVCRHAGNGSRTGGRLRQYLCYRNRAWMIQKNEGWWGRCRGFLLGPLYDLPRFFYLALTNPYFFHPPRIGRR